MVSVVWAVRCLRQSWKQHAGELEVVAINDLSTQKPMLTFKYDSNYGISLENEVAIRIGINGSHSCLCRKRPRQFELGGNGVDIVIESTVFSTDAFPDPKGKAE